MKSRQLLRWMLTALLLLVAILPVEAQGGRAVRDRYSRTDTYGDVVEIRLREPGTLEEKMTPEMKGSRAPAARRRSHGLQGF